MKRSFQTMGILVGAIVCFAIGVLGLLLPILPGWIFLVLGVYLASLRSRIVARQLDRLYVRVPAARHAARQLEALGAKARYQYRYMWRPRLGRAVRALYLVRKKRRQS